MHEGTRQPWYKRKSKSKSENPRERYDARLTVVEACLDERVRANACPDDKLDNYEFLGRLGKGGFASVYLVKRERTQYALKIISKKSLQQSSNAVREKKIQHACRFDFICRLDFAFQDFEHLFLTMEYAPNGSLRGYIEDGKNFLTPWATKAFTAQIILALEYLHTCNILHRDVKPENLIVFEDGYLKLTDFGVAKKVTDRTFSVTGSPGYMAPEFDTADGYGKFVDWWAMGITVYEFLFGRRPYGPLTRLPLMFPKNADTDSPACDFIRGLLNKDLLKRLGCNGLLSIKNHEWFKDLDFYDVFSKRHEIALDYQPKQPLVGAKYDFCMKTPVRDDEVPWVNSF